ncbi:MAG: hypothetical protein BACB_00351 [Bacteroides thetaiotaomicron]
MTKIEIFSLTACFRYVFLEKNPLKKECATVSSGWCHYPTKIV